MTVSHSSRSKVLAIVDQHPDRSERACGRGKQGSGFVFAGEVGLEQHDGTAEDSRMVAAVCSAAPRLPR